MLIVALVMITYFDYHLCQASWEIMSGPVLPIAGTQLHLAHPNMRPMPRW